MKEKDKVKLSSKKEDVFGVSSSVCLNHKHLKFLYKLEVWMMVKLSNCTQIINHFGNLMLWIMNIR